ncbi:TetR/AcrR family transcriptional regulator [Prauserella cavernicola]|uniref:TetR/AcrR family transcriptional regulator n=1 Tax=Prauserella cavernicola TaxID=2800127 RepID=A0A934V4E7_9PSEU|nr:TetR/AcrR family transcriptional regulator [Prauserella cavernicola]MBK1788291.1 TetR/AcrR family transcriptional regulator [Prauserella cavernicola]
MGTREDIIAAAARIMRSDGYARATTKQIARAAGYSEAALYKHFDDKTEIFLSVLAEQLPGLVRLLAELNSREPGEDVRADLVEVARTAIEFYAETFPLAVSVFSSRDFLAAHRDRLREVDPTAGPARPLRELAGYLRGARDRGGLPEGADPDALAALLLGACFQQAFLIDFEGGPLDADEVHALAERLVGTLTAGW